MQPVHVNPLEATEAHQTLEAATSLAVHFGCFELADEGPVTPVVELDAACQELGVDRANFWTLAVGEARRVPPIAAVKDSSEGSRRPRAWNKR
jgi:L-ascorbate metabolism protein UlaG (beta-lactamase superfamily)